MRIAIIGSGAAAAGVLLGLERWGPRDIDVTVFELGQRIDVPFAGAGEHGPDEAYVHALYRRLHTDHGHALPPPKTRFGHTMTKLDVDGRPQFWSSPHRGGMTNFWGGGMHPFTDRELRGWPLSRAELAPYYRLVADAVGITGERGVLDDYYGESFVNRPPLATSPVMERLAQRITGARPDRHRTLPYRLLAGKSHLTVETRPGHERQCVYNGVCSLGCVRQAIWSAADEIDRHGRSGLIKRFITGRVDAIADRHVLYTPGERAHEQPRGSKSARSAGPFDRIFVAAGCIGSTEIAMRSLGLTAGPVLRDNVVAWFPIVSLGSTRGAAEIDARRYFALCNLSLLAVPHDRQASTVPLGVYPGAEHAWRYFTPEPLWPLVRGISNLSRWHLLLGRAYFGDDANPRFSVELTNSGLVMRTLHVPDIARRMDAVMRSLRAALAGSGFFVPPLRPWRHGTTAHYAGTLPYGGAIVDVPRDGAIAPGVHLADASVFPSLPGIHLTFTIMANASRTAQESLG